MFVTNKNST